MMTFAHRHPESTRTMFGIGLDSPRRSNLAERGRWAEAALSGLARLCRLEAACAALTPALDNSVASLCVDEIVRPPFLVDETSFRAHMDEVLGPGG